MKLVQFHDGVGDLIIFDAEQFCYAHTHYNPPPPPGQPELDEHTTIIGHTGHNFRVQETIDKVYEILKEALA